MEIVSNCFVETLEIKKISNMEKILKVIDLFTPCFTFQVMFSLRLMKLLRKCYINTTTTRPVNTMNFR